MIYEIGRRYSQFIGADGLFLSLDESGALLICRMRDPTPKERSAIKAGQPIQIGMCELAGLLVWTVGFGDLNTMDCTYTPHIVARPPELMPPEDGMGYALTVVLADAVTGEILSLRVLGLPHDFSAGLKTIYDKIKTEDIDLFYSYQQINSRSTKELDDMATMRCIIGCTEGGNKQ